MLAQGQASCPRLDRGVRSPVGQDEGRAGPSRKPWTPFFWKGGSPGLRGSAGLLLPGRDRALGASGARGPSMGGHRQAQDQPLVRRGSYHVGRPRGRRRPVEHRVQARSEPRLVRRVSQLGAHPRRQRRVQPPVSPLAESRLRIRSARPRLFRLPRFLSACRPLGPPSRLPSAPATSDGPGRAPATLAPLPLPGPRPRPPFDTEPPAVPASPRRSLDPQPQPAAASLRGGATVTRGSGVDRPKKGPTPRRRRGRGGGAPTVAARGRRGGVDAGGGR